MKCPFCQNPDTKVIDSRTGKDSSSIRRRRECEQCGKRFTTHERLEEILPFVIKKDGRREPYDREKIVSGFQKACEKRPISIEDIERAVTQVEVKLLQLGEREVPTAKIGEMVMEALKEMDDVAYVRFASVYRSFKDIGEFVELIKDRKSESSGK
jgi:transcriptional repressor NrdR